MPDFATQDDAQAYFETNGVGQQQVDRLDADSDGSPARTARRFQRPASKPGTTTPGRPAGRLADTGPGNTPPRPLWGSWPPGCCWWALPLPGATPVERLPFPRGSFDAEPIVTSTAEPPINADAPPRRTAPGNVPADPDQGRGGRLVHGGRAPQVKAAANAAGHVQAERASRPTG